MNGSWDGKTGDEAKADIPVTITGYEGDTLKLKASDIPDVGDTPNDTYKEGSWDVTPDTETEVTDGATYTYTYVQKDTISATVTFKVVNGNWNNGKSTDVVITLTGYEGDTLELKASDIPGAGKKPAEGYQVGSWDKTPAAGKVEAGSKTTYTYTYKAEPTPTPEPDPEPTPPTPTPTPAPAPDGGGNVAPVVPADDGTVIPDEPVPEVEPEPETVIPDEPTPTALNWAVLNLVSAILTALGAVVALFRKKEEEDDDEYGEDDNRDKKMLASKIAGALAGVAAPITFFLTEDMSNVPTLVDKWTVLMAAMLAVQVVAAVFNKKASELSDEEEGAEETAN